MNAINIILFLRQDVNTFPDFNEYCFRVHHNLKLKDFAKLLSAVAAECYEYIDNADIYCDGKTYCTIDLYTKLFKDEYAGLLRISQDLFFKTIENDIRKALEDDRIRN